MSDMPMHDPDEVQFSMLMPYVACQSNDGAFEDRAFVAGSRLGQAWAELKSCPRATGWADYVEPEMVAQYDLLAMHFGFVMTAEPWPEHPDDWVRVVFTRPTVEGPDVDEP